MTPSTMARPLTSPILASPVECIRPFILDMIDLMIWLTAFLQVDTVASVLRNTDEDDLEPATPFILLQLSGTLVTLLDLHILNGNVKMLPLRCMEPTPTARWPLETRAHLVRSAPLGTAIVLQWTGLPAWNKVARLSCITRALRTMVWNTVGCVELSWVVLEGSFTF